MLYWLASYPRSGNHFFRYIVESRYNIATWDKYKTPHKSHQYFEHIKSIESAINADIPVLMKTHDLAYENKYPAIYLVRDGRDSLVSYTHYTLNFLRKQADKITPQIFRDTLLELMLETRSPFGTWAENVLSWTARSKTYVVRFEDLVRNPSQVVDNALAAIGLSCNVVSDYIPTFNQIRQINPEAARRGTIGSWKDEFPVDLLPLFWEKFGHVMRKLGYNDCDIYDAAA